MLTKSQIGFVSGCLKTNEGKRFDECLRVICEVDSSIVPGEDMGKICPTTLAVQAGRRSVFNKILAAKKVGERIG